MKPAYEKQDVVFAAAFSVLERAIAARAFPAASIAVTHRGRLVALKAFGKPVYEVTEGAPSLSRSARQDGEFDFPITPSTLFDLASLTKVVATTTMAMILYERGLLELDAPILGTIPEFLVDSCGQPDPRRRDVTFRMLLGHSSGLPAYEKLYLKARSREELLRAALTAALSADPGTRAEYSDIGFMNLGVALERIAQEPLDTFCQREIFGPLGMAHTTFHLSAETRRTIPPTADDRTFRHRIIQGEVQDENAFVLGGVAAHAGLFSTAEDLAFFAHALLECGADRGAKSGAGCGAGCGADTPVRETLRSQPKSDVSQSNAGPILRQETLALFTRRELSPAGTTRALGWDTPSSPSQSGKYFGARSFGHLGYTGTSLWIDPERELCVTLLTNRTWPDCSNQAIKQIRPKFHDAVVEAVS